MISGEPATQDSRTHGLMDLCTLCGMPGGKRDQALGLDHWPAAWRSKGRLTQDQRKRYGLICWRCRQVVRRIWGDDGEDG